MSIKLWCCSWLCWWYAGKVKQIIGVFFGIILKNCVYPLLQSLELNLWSQSPDVNIVFGFEENSMRLYQDDREAINANNIGLEEFKFCYVEVKLISTDEEQFENVNYWDGLNNHFTGVTVLKSNLPWNFQTIKDGRRWGTKLVRSR